MTAPVAEKLKKVAVPHLTGGLVLDVDSRSIKNNETPDCSNILMSNGIAGTRPGRFKYNSGLGDWRWDDFNVLPELQDITWDSAKYSWDVGTFTESGAPIKRWDDFTTETWDTVNDVWDIDSKLDGPVLHVTSFKKLSGTYGKELIIAITSKSLWYTIGSGWQRAPAKHWIELDSSTVVTTTAYPTSEGEALLISKAWDDQVKIWTPNDSDAGDWTSKSVIPIRWMTGYTPFNLSFYAMCIRQLSEHVVMLGVIEYDHDTHQTVRIPHRVRWSDVGSAVKWDESQGTAGFVDLVGTHGDIMGPDFIVTGEKIGNALAIYKEWSIYLMQYVGGSAIFRFTCVVPNVGAFSPRCVVPVAHPKGEMHVVLGRHFPYIFNGTSQIMDIGRHRVAQAMMESINYLYAFRSFGYYVPEKHLVRFHLCTGNSSYPNAIYEYNIDENSWPRHATDDKITFAAEYSLRGMPWLPGQSFRWVYTGDEDGWIGRQDGIDEQFGEDRVGPYDTYITTKRFVIQNETDYLSLKARILRIACEAKGSGTLNVYVRYDGGSWVSAGSTALTSEFQDYYFYVNNTSKDVQVKFQTDGPDYFFLRWVQIGYQPKTGR